MQTNAKEAPPDPKQQLKKLWRLFLADCKEIGNVQPFRGFFASCLLCFVSLAIYLLCALCLALALDMITEKNITSWYQYRGIPFPLFSGMADGWMFLSLFLSVWAGCFGLGVGHDITKRIFPKRIRYASYATIAFIVMVYLLVCKPRDAQLMFWILAHATFFGIGLLMLLHKEKLEHSLLDEIRAKRTEILAIAERCGLKDIKIFGSVARGEERPDSDVDFLVTADPNSAKGIETFGFPGDVASLIGRKVDMVFEKGLRPTVRKYVMQDVVPL